MNLLLYYNLFAQAPDGLAMTPIAAGLSLMPFSVAIFGLPGRRLGSRPGSA
jgi:DHA2 family multidrug resistance protein-like MFS transporter